MKSPEQIEILRLRTQLNLAIKGLSQIEYTANHGKTAPYDYGEGAMETIAKIRTLTSETKQSISRAGATNKHLKNALS
jgi:hypothetical protein